MRSWTSEECGELSATKRKDILEEARRVAELALKHGVVLRLAGGLAIEKQCQDVRFCSREHRDIDFVGLSNQASSIRKMFDELQYTENRHVAISTANTKLSFSKNNLDVDIFLDSIRMEHSINLTTRLLIDDSTISISDLLLTKLIINDMNEKDWRDIFTIVKESVLGQSDSPHMLNTGYLADLCSGDWGLYQDIVCNINKSIDFINHFGLTPEERANLEYKLLTLRNELEESKKSWRWKLRALLGKRIQWRDVVQEESASMESLSELSSSSHRKFPNQSDQ